MGTTNRLIVVIAGLTLFTGLAITLLLLGQPAAAIAPIIMVIVLGVRELLQAFDDSNRRSKPNPPAPLSPARPEVDRPEQAAQDPKAVEAPAVVHEDVDDEDEGAEDEGRAA
ncbi:hypothetical protein ABZZ74_47755 [Streptomyces sp. NPDC006476]|uniref:hypothetical protein n=1 Tax=Streptomyces sp. NPDC006476 TaxID=3157175 RepID=UPI00339F06C1